MFLQHIELSDIYGRNEDGTQTVAAEELIVGDIFDSQDGLTHRVKIIRESHDGKMVVIVEKLESSETYPADFQPHDPVTIL